MQLTKVHLFLILIFALILASSLGNYVRRDGFSTTKPPALPDALQPLATKDDSSNTKVSTNTRYDPNMNNGLSASSAGSPVSAFSPSTFPMNTPAGIPGMNSVSGNDEAGTSGSVNNGGGGGCNSKPQCPPCPACARCPEPAFECKKVPNYSRSEDINGPRPVMADFSQFGM
jgi:hypothetical protein